LGCIEYASFVVLINGSPSNFFNSSRGLCQGCPLSPFLFLIMAEGFNKLILEAKEKGLLKGLKISESELITHQLFVDDVLIFGASDVQEFQVLKDIMELFCEATGMEINHGKIFS
jgi:hypothetical protein